MTELQFAYLLALIFFVIALGVTVWWRYAAATNSELLVLAEKDRIKAVSQNLDLEKLVVALRKERDDAVEAQLAAERIAASLKANMAAQRTENAGLHSDLAAYQDGMAALLERLRVNLNAKRPAPWKATIATILQEYGRG